VGVGPAGVEEPGCFELESVAVGYEAVIFIIFIIFWFLMVIIAYSQFIIGELLPL
jgi:hypothetical protein